MKVKVPENIAVGSFDYKIVSVPNLANDYKLLGQSLADSQVIKIEADSTPQTKAQVLFHEMVHAISDVYNCELEEKNIDRIAQGIASVLARDFGIELSWEDIE